MNTVQQKSFEGHRFIPLDDREIEGVFWNEYLQGKVTGIATDSFERNSSLIPEEDFVWSESLKELEELEDKVKEIAANSLEPIAKKRKTSPEDLATAASVQKLFLGDERQKIREQQKGLCARQFNEGHSSIVPKRLIFDPNSPSSLICQNCYTKDYDEKFRQTKHKPCSIILKNGEMCGRDWGKFYPHAGEPDCACSKCHLRLTYVPEKKKQSKMNRQAKILKFTQQAPSIIFIPFGPMFPIFLNQTTSIK